MDRLALRLLLVLRYADEVGGGYESLRRWLAQDDFSCEPVLLRRDPLGRKEKMMAAGMLAALCAVWYFP